MQARFHVAASVIASAATCAASQSATMAAVTLVSGIFIDADHLLDYIVLYRPPYSIRQLTDIYYNNSLTHIFLLLHSWELIGILAIAAMALHWHPVVTGLLIGMGHHLLIDQIFNAPYPLGYFLTFRIYHRLAHDRCFRRRAKPRHSKERP
jgi:hypothetical protein